jgi:hypothetical protein
MRRVMSKPGILREWRTSPTNVVASHPYLKEMKKAPYPVAPAAQRSKIHYRCEADRIETGFAYQESVDFRLRHKTLRVARLDAAAVKDADASRRFCSKTVLRLSADEPVSIAGPSLARRSRRRRSPRRVHRRLRFSRTAHPQAA